MKSLPGVLPLAILGLLTAAARADLDIVPTYESSITGDPNATLIENTIQGAINSLDSDIANNVTVHIDFGETSSGLGQSSTYQYGIDYTSYLANLKADQTLSVQDTIAIASLPGTAPVGNGNIATTGPLLRAFGYNTNQQPDSTIEFNNSLISDSAGTPPAGKYSLASVVLHEMNEVLGIGGGGSQISSGASLTNQVDAGPLDLFRYSGVGTRSTTATAGADPYFSINNGVTKIEYFNQSGTGDYGDWGNGVTNAQYGNTPPLVQDAFGTPGTNPQLSSAELTALDVVGWNLTAQGTLIEDAPEPSTWALLIGGAATLAFIRHRSKARA